MPYPFALIAGDCVARINHDGTWSVRWDRILDVVYQPPHPRRIAVIAYARMLLTAKDNFLVTPWDVSEGWADKWTHFECAAEYIDCDPELGGVLSIIKYNGKSIAKVNYDGSWSILWEDVAELARCSTDDYRGLALFALCKLFMSAKDRFWPTPWVETNDLD